MFSAYINVLQSAREVRPQEPILDNDAKHYIIGRGDLTNLVPIDFKSSKVPI